MCDPDFPLNKELAAEKQAEAAEAAATLQNMKEQVEGKPALQDMKEQVEGKPEDGNQDAATQPTATAEDEGDSGNILAILERVQSGVAAQLSSEGDKQKGDPMPEGPTEEKQAASDDLAQDLAPDLAPSLALAETSAATSDDLALDLAQAEARAARTALQAP